MKVVLDTNVIIAAFVTRGLCKDIFEYCLQETTIIVSNPLLVELSEAFQRKFKFSEAKVAEIRELLLMRAELVNPAELRYDLCRDPDDIMVLATAKAAKAKAIVTGDEDLLVLKKFEDTLILSPRDFWDLLAGRAKRKA